VGRKEKIFFFIKQRWNWYGKIPLLQRWIRGREMTRQKREKERLLLEKLMNTEVKKVRRGKGQ
jgi:hypothetical protein